MKIKKNLVNVWELILLKLFGKKTLNNVLYILTLFLVKELAAISASSEILSFTEYLKNKFPNSNLAELISEIIKVIFSNGSYSILFITIAVLILILFVRFFDTSKLNPVLKLLSFIGFTSILFLTLWNNKEKEKLNTSEYSTTLKLLENKLSKLDSIKSQDVSSYLQLIKKTNSKFNTFLQNFSDSLEHNHDFTGIVYLTAPAGYGKSYFTKKWIEEEIENVSIGKIKVREHFVCHEQESECYSDSLNIKINQVNDLEATTNKGDKVSLGWIYDYDFNAESILKFYGYDKGINVLMIDDLDEVSEATTNRYLKQFENLIESRKFPDIKLIIFLSRTEALTNYLSNSYREPPNVSVIYGSENNSLNNVVFSNHQEIRYRVDNWANWYEKRISDNILDDERHFIQSVVSELYDKYDYIKLQLQIQSNSDFLLRCIKNKRISINSSEQDIKKILFNLMVGRNADSHHRPALDSEEGIIYKSLLQKIVLNKINKEKINKMDGWFLVENNDMVSTTLNGITYSTTVKSLLNRSGMVRLAPTASKISKYKFEPFWIHRYLLESSN